MTGKCTGGKLAGRRIRARGPAMHAGMFAKILTASHRLGIPTHWRTDLEHDRRLIERHNPGEAVWGVRDTGTDLFIKVGRKEKPPAMAYRPFSSPPRKVARRDWALDWARAVINGRNNQFYYYLTRNSARRIAPEEAMKIIAGWHRAGWKVRNA